MIDIKLSNDEALVLFDWLAKFNQRDKIQHLDELKSSEKRVLNSIECMLESELPSIFEPNYKELLEAARKRIDS